MGTWPPTLPITRFPTPRSSKFGDVGAGVDGHRSKALLGEPPEIQRSGGSLRWTPTTFCSELGTTDTGSVPSGRHAMPSCRFVALAVVMLAAVLARSPGVDAAAKPPDGTILCRAGHLEDLYGRTLPITMNLGIGPTMAARVAGKTLCTIGRGRLRVFDISDPARPVLAGVIKGLGNTRQVALQDQVAYITSREDGVFIVDVKNPRRPELLCHYDPIEVATGIDVSGEVMFVACRLHGLELVDVSEPSKPLHLSTVRTGEAQSVEVHNGYAYVGVWGTSELVVVNVQNPRRPEITARRPLDGFGDGVAVQGGYVYAATGHHSRARKVSRPAEGEIGYGCGHGLEIFSITDPARPVFVSRIKTPPFYRIGNDMWGVKIAGRVVWEPGPSHLQPKRLPHR